MVALQDFIIGTLFMAAMVTGFAVLFNDVSTTYGADFDDSQLQLFNKTGEVSSQAATLREQITTGEEVSTQESLTSFFSAAFTSGKLITDSLATLTVMIQAASDIFGVPGFLLATVTGILSVLLVFRIALLITGRFG